MQTSFKDWWILWKGNLNLFVLMTTFFGFWFAPGRAESWDIFGHLMLGTALMAFGASAFNQIMEIDFDKLMKRTADRPLPAQRMSIVTAFACAWFFSAFGLLHLALKVNDSTAWLGAIVLGTYVFIYTPMKRKSPWNTMVGGITGALPPVMGWTAGGGDWYAWMAVGLFVLLFFWQLPHFFSISWLCRKEYEKAGYKMWTNYDDQGVKMSKLCVCYAVMLLLSVIGVALIPSQAFPLWLVIVGIAVTIPMVLKAWRLLPAFSAQLDDEQRRIKARQLFFTTLWWLPAIFGAMMLASVF